MWVNFPSLRSILGTSPSKFFALFVSVLPLTSYSAVNDDDFNQCKVNLAQRAQTAGFSSRITTDVITGLAPLTKVIELDKRQPEFTQTFEQYVKARVTNYHVETGKQKLESNKALFDKLEQTYGVPRQYLVSFWGLETVFGKYKGKMSTLNALATLACDERRSEYFTKELFNLFTLIEKQEVSIEQLQGSWAGAMGHMQFMPTAYLTYAIDGDNDGEIDLWQSEADALTSAANYLQQIGWQSEERWGREVLLPDNFKFSKIEFDQYYPLSYFKELGVTKVDKQALADYDIKAELYLPSGHRGPAFLLYPNFNVIMKWNLSKSYALSVGMLANKLIGAQGIQAFGNNTEDEQINSYRVSEMKELQQNLNELGYETGKPDGIWGPQSRNAIRAFQLKHELVADGFPNKEVFTTVNEVMSQS